MTTRHLVDPELLPLLEQFPSLEPTRESLPEIRRRMTAMLEQAAKVATAFPGVDVSERHVPGAPGSPEVRVLVYKPKSAPQKTSALLWIHGGGYVLGYPEQDDLKIKAIVSAIGCVAVSVDYRLAPDTVHPGPVEDCYAGLEWLHDHAGELGVDTKRIAVGGESAGGGLAACLALLARDRREVPLAFQLLIYPMLDDRTVTRDHPHPYTGEFVWTANANAFGWGALLGRPAGSQGIAPYAAAARAEDLGGLPPTYIAVGALDLFLEENLDYARRLTRAAVPTELHLYPGAFHGFALMFPMMADAAISQAHARDMMAALSRALRER